MPEEATGRGIRGGRRGQKRVTVTSRYRALQRFIGALRVLSEGYVVPRREIPEGQRSPSLFLRYT